MSIAFINNNESGSSVRTKLNSTIDQVNSGSFNIVSATNNGNGTNFQVGDDVWIGDVNISNTMQVKGQQDGTKGFIKFGSGSNSVIIGGNNNNTLQVTGSINVTSGVTGSLFGTATTASYWSGSVTNATTASYWSGSVTNSTSASYALTASYAMNGGGNGISASYATTASYALSSAASVAGNPVVSVLTLSSSYSASLSDCVLLLTGSAVTVTLPTAVGNNGKMYYIKNLNSAGTHTLKSAGGRVETAAANTGVSVSTIGTSGGQLIMVSNNIDWWELGTH